MIDGEAVKRNSPIISSSWASRMIYQELNLIPELSIVKNIFSSEAEKFRRPGVYVSGGRKPLQMLHLDIDPDTLVKDLGVGTQQMVENRKAVSKRSKCWCAGRAHQLSDGFGIRELFSIIRMLKEQGWACSYLPPVGRTARSGTG